MPYENTQAKISQFTTEAPTLDTFLTGITSGNNRKFTVSQLMAIVSSIYGASLRTYATQSEMVADDIQLGEYAICEENNYALYKITSIAATGQDVALSSGLVATFAAFLSDEYLCKKVQYTTDCAALDLSGLNGFESVWYDSNKISDSGGTWLFTGTTTAARSGDGVYSDGYFYDSVGNQFQFQGIPNVCAFGARGTGNNVDAFQNAIYATPDSEVTFIKVPSGSYSGNYSSLDLGTRNVSMIESGGVIFTGTRPMLSRIGSKFSGDENRPWLDGEFGLGKSYTDPSITDRPMLRMQRQANYDGGTPGENASIISMDLSINSDSTTSADKHENGILVELNCYRNSTSESPDVCMMKAILDKFEISTGGFFGNNFVCRDRTGRMSSVSRGSLIATEMSVAASGPDDTDSRIVIDAIGRGYDASGDGATEIGYGVRVRSAASGIVTDEPANIKKAFATEEGNLGSIGICYSADGGTFGINFSGSYSDKVIKTLTDELAEIRLGSIVNTNGLPSSQLVFAGYNSSNSEVAYSRVRSVVGSNTASSEHGRIDLDVRISGTMTNALRINAAASTVNPLFIYVGGSLQQVTAGANDSATTGFRSLMVPNV